MKKRTQCNRLSILVLPLAIGLRAPRLVAEEEFIRGDINLDGRVTLADASYFFDARFLGAPAPACIDSVDTDDNGTIDFSGLSDVVYLLEWLFRSGPAPPAPFPLPGADPSADAILCAEATITPPGEPHPGFEMSWEHAPVLRQGDKDVEFFLVVDTGTPIESFSIAFRVEKASLENLRADFEGTIFPQAVRSQFESSPLFRMSVGPSADPDHALFIVGAVFVRTSTTLLKGIGGAYERIVFPATAGPVQSVRLLRILADVRMAAPVGPGRVVLAAAEDEDFLAGGEGIFHGVLNEFGASFHEPISPSIEPFAIGLASVGMAPAGEIFFVRADANGSLGVDISDPLSTLDFLFSGEDALACLDAADSNDDGTLDITDPLYTLNWLFSGGPGPGGTPDPRICFFDQTADLLGGCVSDCE